MDKVIKHSKKAAAKVAPITTKTINEQVGGFGEFIKEFGVIGLAVGFVFGAQVKTVVDIFTASIINPLLGLLLPGAGSLSQKTFSLTVFSKTAVFGWGVFISSLISFIIVAIIIYATYKIFHLDRLAQKNNLK
jgi:large conductance mechanosensitive channel